MLPTILSAILTAVLVVSFIDSILLANQVLNAGKIQDKPSRTFNKTFAMGDNGRWGVGDKTPIHHIGKLASFVFYPFLLLMAILLISNMAGNVADIIAGNIDPGPLWSRYHIFQALSFWATEILREDLVSMSK